MSSIPGVFAHPEGLDGKFPLHFTLLWELSLEGNPAALTVFFRCGNIRKTAPVPDRDLTFFRNTI
jgi:hypothetical protein